MIHTIRKPHEEKKLVITAHAKTFRLDIAVSQYRSICFIAFGICVESGFRPPSNYFFRLCFGEIISIEEGLHPKFLNNHTVRYPRLVVQVCVFF